MVVDLLIPLQGRFLPADHGYGLFAALCKHLPELHQHHDIGVLSTPGVSDFSGKIALTDHSGIRLRLPVEKIPLVYRLAGKPIVIGMHKVHLGIPQIHPLRFHPDLRSRIVIIKGYEEPESFLAAANRQLRALGVNGEPLIPLDRRGRLARKTLKIRRFTVVGFTLEIRGLSESESMHLQVQGLGGKRHLGCGIFLPA
ncbi:MAG: type I-MYXAN CRISPR-associated protein Cas6/Cmx6 [Pseudanabaenaceae cyanobacterium]